MNEYHQAIKSDDIATVQLIYREQRNLVYLLNDFEYACKKGSLNVVKWFMDNTRINMNMKQRGLIRASKRGHLAVVKFLLDMNNVPGIFYRSMNAACRAGYIDVVRYLYDYIVTDSDYVVDMASDDPHTDEYSKIFLFELACINGHLHIVEYLLDKDDIFLTYISYAFYKSCEHGLLHIAQYLSNRAVIEDNRVTNALNSAACNGHVHVIEWLLKTFRDVSPRMLLDCACSSNLETVLWIVDNVPDITKGNHKTAFANACTNNCLQVVEWVLANVDIAGTGIFGIGERFRVSCCSGHLQISQLLFDKCPEAQACVSASNLFSAVCAHNHLDVTKWLMSIEACIDIYGAFTSACGSTNSMIARFLLGTFPEINIHANSEHAFLQACEDTNVAIMRLFTEYSDDIASYHIMTDADQYYGYLITKTDLCVVSVYIKTIKHNDMYIYVIDDADDQLVVQDVKSVIAMSRKKSAKN